MERKELEAIAAVGYSLNEIMEAIKSLVKAVTNAIESILEAIKKAHEERNKFDPPIYYPPIKINPLKSQVLDKRPKLPNIRNNC